MIDRGDGTGVRQWQSDALLEAEKLSKKKRTKLAAALDLGYDQYARYVNGQTPLRAEQIPLFAEAYGVDVIGLARAILTGDTSTVKLTWSFHDTLRGIVPENLIAEQWEEVKNDAIKDQKAHAQEMLNRVAQRRDESKNPPKTAARRRRPAPERTARGA